MNLKNGRHGELLELLELLCEERLSPSEIERLESLVLEDRDARTLYLSYINLHGTLYWDEASGGTALPEPTEEPVVAPMRRTGWWSRSRVAAVAAVAAVVLVAVVVSESWSPDGPGEAVVGPPEPGPGPVNVNPEPPERRNTLRVGPSVPLANKRTPAPEAPEGVIPDQPEPGSPEKPRGSSGAGSLSAVVASIDNRIEQGWRDNETRIPSGCGESISTSSVISRRRRRRRSSCRIGERARRSTPSSSSNCSTTRTTCGTSRRSGRTC